MVRMDVAKRLCEGAAVLWALLACHAPGYAGVFHVLCQRGWPMPIYGDFFGYYPTTWTPWPDSKGAAPLHPTDSFLPDGNRSAIYGIPGCSSEPIPSMPRPLPGPEPTPKP
jgi:hypothetical protein